MVREYHKDTNIERRVRIVYERGLLKRYGAQSELARIIGTSRQRITQVVRKIEAEGSVNRNSQHG